MARKCQKTGAKSSSGNNRSHSNRATKRTFRPNLVVKKLWNPETGRFEKMKVSTSALRTYTRKEMVRE